MNLGYEKQLKMADRLLHDLRELDAPVEMIKEAEELRDKLKRRVEESRKK